MAQKSKEIETLHLRFEGNLERVHNLVALYDKLTPQGRGRREVAATDLLRAAVVLLHASFEDLLRSLALWKLPGAAPEVLRELPALGKSDGKGRIGLEELARHRGRTVDELITNSVDAYLEKSNYNHPGDVKRLLVQCGLSEKLVAPFAGPLGTMMNRRHWIVHRVDRNYNQGSGQHLAKSLGKNNLILWIETTQGLGHAILTAAAGDHP